MSDGVADLLEAMDILLSALKKISYNAQNFDSKFNARFKEYRENLIEETQNEIDKEFSVKEEEIITNSFNKSVRAFYEDFNGPKVYERRYSLYNILNITYYEDSQQIDYDTDDYEVLFDESKMGKGRNGCSLYDLVFKEGYHGGAKSGQAGLTDVHPNPGTPYYRRSGYIRKKPGKGGGYRYRFGAWGRPAAKSDKSAYVMMKEEMAANESEFDNIYEEIENKYAETMIERYKKEQEKVLEEILFEGVDL